MAARNRRRFQLSRMKRSPSLLSAYPAASQLSHMLLMPSSFTRAPEASSSSVPETESAPCKSTGVGPALFAPASLLPAPASLLPAPPPLLLPPLVAFMPPAPASDEGAPA